MVRSGVESSSSDGSDETRTSASHSGSASSDSASTSRVQGKSTGSVSTKKTSSKGNVTTDTVTQKNQSVADHIENFFFINGEYAVRGACECDIRDVDRNDVLVHDHSTPSDDTSNDDEDIASSSDSLSSSSDTTSSSSSVTAGAVSKKPVTGAAPGKRVSLRTTSSIAIPHPLDDTTESSSESTGIIADELKYIPLLSTDKTVEDCMYSRRRPRPFHRIRGVLHHQRNWNRATCVLTVLGIALLLAAHILVRDDVAHTESEGAVNLLWILPLAGKLMTWFCAAWQAVNWRVVSPSRSRKVVVPAWTLPKTIAVVVSSGLDIVVLVLWIALPEHFQIDTPVLVLLGSMITSLISVAMQLRIVAVLIKTKGVGVRTTDEHSDSESSASVGTIDIESLAEAKGSDIDSSDSSSSSSNDSSSSSSNDSSSSSSNASSSSSSTHDSDSTRDIRGKRSKTPLSQVEKRSAMNKTKTRVDFRNTQERDDYLADLPSYVAGHHIRHAGRYEDDMTPEEVVNAHAHRRAQYLEYYFIDQGNVKKTGSEIPVDVVHERLRHVLSARTKLAVCVTAYNEDGHDLHETMKGLSESIGQMVANKAIQPQEVMVFIIIDGILTIPGAQGEPLKTRLFDADTNPGHLPLGVQAELMGILDRRPMARHIHKIKRGQDVEPGLHLFYQPAFTIHNGIFGNGDIMYPSGIEYPEYARYPFQVMFGIKTHNRKKLSSHDWFFNFVCRLSWGFMRPDRFCYLLDMGTRPSVKSLGRLYEAMKRDSDIAGCAGEIQINNKNNYFNFVVMAQVFEYAVSHFMTKAMESVFGYVTVLPGAFSCYRWSAITRHVRHHLNLEHGGVLELYYFRNLRRRNRGIPTGAFEENMYLAEDRVLCFQLVAMKHAKNKLYYVKNAQATVDAMTTLTGLISQRRRWANGAGSNQLYVLLHFWQLIAHTHHNPLRKFFFLIQWCYYTFGLSLLWVSPGILFLATTATLNPVVDDSPDAVFAIMTIYGMVTFFQFLFALGNKPENIKVLYNASAIFYGLISYATMGTILWTTFDNIHDITTLTDSSPFIVLVIGISAYLTSGALHGHFVWPALTLFHYIGLLPSMINIVMIFSVCRADDLSWGTRGESKTANSFSTFRTFLVIAWVVSNLTIIYVGHKTGDLQGVALSLVIAALAIVFMRFIGSILYQLLRVIHAMSSPCTREAGVSGIEKGTGRGSKYSHFSNGVSLDAVTGRPTTEADSRDSAERSQHSVKSALGAMAGVTVDFQSTQAADSHTDETYSDGTATASRTLDEFALPHEHHWYENPKTYDNRHQRRRQRDGDALGYFGVQHLNSTTMARRPRGGRGALG